MFFQLIVILDDFGCFLQLVMFVRLVLHKNASMLTVSICLDRTCALGLGSIELFSLTSITSAWPSVSPVFHVCWAEGGPCWSCFSCHCEWPLKHQRSRSWGCLFQLCAKITSACWMSWQVRVILLFGQEAWPHEGWDPLSWHNTHTDLSYTPDVVLVLCVCMGVNLWPRSHCWV